jgi:hypothetical protein
MKKDDVVIVKWRDACEQKGVQIETIKGVLPFLVVRETVGVLLHQDKDGVIIASDINEDNEAEIVAIPNKMLISIL